MKEKNNYVTKKCIICNIKLKIKKYAWRQKVCDNEECKKEYKRRYQKQWRKKNPNYYKNEFEIEKNKNNYDSNSYDYVKNWRKKNYKKWKKYMREYMQNIRQNSED